MSAEDNHYQWLGLDLSATPEAIHAAFERRRRQANELAYTSPAQARQLWQRLRDIDRDLLSDRQRREAYDLALLASMDAAPPARSRPAPVPGTPSPPAGASPLRKRRSALPFVAGVVAALLVTAVGAAALLHRTPPTPTVSTAMLMVSLPYQDSAYASGQTVHLRWSAQPGVEVYRLQVAAWPAVPSGDLLFAHPDQTLLIRSTRYAFTVTGEQTYFWRVQAFAHGRWQPYTPAAQFLVARPSIGTPALLSPAAGSVLTSRRARLCWSPVRGALAYVLRIAQQGPSTQQATCVTRTLRPGRYSWSVAALVSGVRVYMGSYAPAATFVIEPRLHPTLIALRPRTSLQASLVRLPRSSVAAVRRSAPAASFGVVSVRSVAVDRAPAGYRAPTSPIVRPAPHAAVSHPAPPRPAYRAAPGAPRHQPRHGSPASHTPAVPLPAAVPPASSPVRPPVVQVPVAAQPQPRSHPLPPSYAAAAGASRVPAGSRPAVQPGYPISHPAVGGPAPGPAPVAALRSHGKRSNPIHP